MTYEVITKYNLHMSFFLLLFVILFYLITHDIHNEYFYKIFIFNV